MALDPEFAAPPTASEEVRKPKKYIIQRKTGNKWKDTGWTSLPDGWDTKHPKPVLLAKAKSCVKKAQEMWPKETYRITEMVRP